MKKVIISVLTLVFILSASFIVLAKKEAKKNEVYFLIRGTPAEVELWKKAVNAFMKENKGIKVRMEHTPYNEYWTKIQTMMAGGLAPDVIFLESTRVASFIKIGQLLALDDYVKKDKEFNKNDFYPESINAYMFQNKLYGIPNDIAIYAIYFNKDMFDQNGVKYPNGTWNWEEFKKACIALTRDDNKDGVPETFGFNIGWTYYLWIWQNSGDFYDNPKNPTKAVINSPEVKGALQYLKDLIYKYKASPSFAQASSFGNSAEMFMTGRVAMIIEGHWMVPEFRNIKSFKWDVADITAAELPKGKVKANYGAGSCFAIPKVARNRENAWKLIKFLSGDKGQEILIKSGLSTPALRTPKITKLFLDSRPPANNKVFLDMISYAHLPPLIPRYNEMSDTMYRELDSFWLNEKSADEVLKTLEKKLNEFIK
ncbi:MAG: sugar ABC transporter substrate-binding protein [bacterium]|nr:sugar ABC transporter substrate-binding protein [bacterium]